MKCVESGGAFIKILFITSDYSKPNKGENIYTDLAKALNNKHDIKVVATEEKKNTNKTYLNKENGIDVLRVKIGNLYEVGLIEKGFTILTIGYHLKKGIKKFFSKEKFDLILFQSPPLTMASAVKKVPVILQMEPLECGAASLAMIFAYYKNVCLLLNDNFFDTLIQIG